MSITSDYLQFDSEDIEGKASNSTLHAVFIQSETGMSVLEFENTSLEDDVLIRSGPGTAPVDSNHRQINFKLRQTVLKEMLKLQSRR